MFRKILLLILIILLGYFLYWRYKLGLTKLFDIDEFAHLHWSYNLYSGKHPYTDFFYFFPPLFLYVLASLFAVSAKTVSILIYGRWLMFLSFLGASIVLFLLVKKVRNIQTALLTLVIFSFLPIPADKWIEIRPDPVASFSMILGMYFLVSGILSVKPLSFFFLSGLFYVLAAAILPKVILYAGVAFFIVFGFSIIFRKSSAFFAYLAGGFIPIIAVLLLFVSYGNFQKALYLTTVVSAKATQLLGSKFPIPPNFLFYPNDVYFGAPGESLPWKINLIIWLSGIGFSIIQFVSFANCSHKKERLVKLLISASFLVNLIVFVQLLKLRHGQYLVPLSFFIALYSADFIMKLLAFVKIRFFKNIFILAVIAIIALAGKQMYETKLRWTNQADLNYYTGLYKAIGNEKVIDLTGETVYGNDGYYFCCVPYGQYIEALNFAYPNIETAIEKNKIKYVYVQTIDRLSVLPMETAEIIRKYFVPFDSPGLNKGLMKLKSEGVR